MSNATNTAARQQIAQTILAQLGGSRFLAMTGSRNLIALESGLSFKLGRFSGVKTTHVRVTLTPLDLYNVEFLAIRGTSIKTIATVEGVYADQLREVFTAETGLHTSLGTMRG